MKLAYTVPTSTPSLFTDADVAYEDLKARLVSGEWTGLVHGEVERLVRSVGQEVLRLLFASHVRLRTQAEPLMPVVGADGSERTHQKRARLRLLETTFGTIPVERTSYAGRGLSGLHPVDADLNLPVSKYSHELQRLAVLISARQSFESATELVTTMTSAHLGKRQVEGITAEASRDFDAFYGFRRWTPASQKDTGPLLIISIDQKGIVMMPDHLTPETRNVARALRHALPAVRNRDGKSHWRGRKRMATVATVYTIEPDTRTAEDVVHGLRRIESQATRPVRTVRPQLKRVWASLERSPQNVINDALAEAKKRDPLNAKRWVVLIDGDPDLERWVRNAAKKHHVDVTIGLDIIHALQYLWRAGETLCGKDPAAVEDWTLERLLRILRGDVSNTIAGIARSATLRGLKRHQRREVDRCCSYLLNRKNILRFDQLLSWGAPIATGVIEGGCKHLINDRLQLCGARWTLAGAEAMLRVRAIVISGDFDEYWQFHERADHQRNHASQYAAGQPPAVGLLKRRRRHLAVV